MPVAQAGRRPVDRTLKSVCRLSEYGLKTGWNVRLFPEPEITEK